MIRLLAAALLALVPTFAHADEIEDYLEASRKSYAAGHLGRATTELQQALVKLRLKVQDQLRSALPPPPQFWQVDTRMTGRTPSAPNMFSGQFIIVYRTETNPISQITLQVMTDAATAYGGSANMALLNPFQAQLQGYTLIEVDGLSYPALFRISAANQSEGMIIIPGRFYLQLRGNGPDAAEAVRGPLVNFDAKRVKELLDFK
jgi:hypothetical protein